MVYKRGRKWTYNVTSQRVRVAIFVMERQQRVFRQANRIFSALSNIIICGLSGSTKFFLRYLIKDTILGKQIMKNEIQIFVLIVSINFCEIFLVIEIIKRNFIIYEGWNFNSGNYLFTTDTK